MHDEHAVRAFLDDAHHEWAERVRATAEGIFAGRTPTHDDDAARRDARRLLGEMGNADFFEPIERRDLRGCCVAREIIAEYSPLADAVFALQGLGITPLLLAGSDEQRADWVGPAVAGEAMGAFALTEPGAGTDVAALTTRATKDADGYVLDGHKWFISNAGIADFYVVFASTDPAAGNRGISAFLVPATTPGLDFLGPQVMSAPHPLGEIRLEGCRVPEGARIGDEGRGFMVAMATLDQLRPTVGAAACGMARRALSEAVRHAVAREQFGQPIADFQIIQDKIGRMSIELAAARLLVYRAGYEKDSGADRITIEAAMAKAFATEAAQRIIDDAVQILGGRGVMAEHPVDHLYRAVRALRIYEGTTEIQHLIVAGRRLADEREGSSA